MVTSTMTKPVVVDAEPAVEVPTAMAAADRPVVVSAPRAAARQVTVAPMTKPKSVDE
jgi:hypothetical protein